MSGPLIEVDNGSSSPPFAQVYEQIATLAATGSLATGARLPAVRQLASDLGVAPGTVARAYRELEQAGIIETRGRHGTFVRAPASPVDVDTGAELRAAARTFAIRVHHLGVHPRDAVEAVKVAMGELSEPNPAVPRPASR